MDIFFDIHKDLPREGPGDSNSTAQAFSLLKDLPPNPLILDIGCGPGMQTLNLAYLKNNRLLAVDNHQPFLTQLKHHAQTMAGQNQIILTNASMFDLPFPANSFDAIWAEGSIYIIGFEKGLLTWQALLKPGGYLAVTEISWLKPDPPQEVVSYWLAEYPGMRSIGENLKIIQTAGYHDIGHFTLPPSSWWTDYYTPIEKRIQALREKYRDNPKANDMLDATQKEIETYRKYSNWYGYVFYVMKVL
jgi:ubiquinone/menaquinone biosynthesis C-methylase UbiE